MAWRIAVILFAGAVVAIGLHPFRKEIKVYVNEAKGVLKKVERSSPPKRKNGNGEIVQSDPTVPPVQFHVPKGPAKKLDHVSDKEREGLSSFIDGLTKEK